MREYTLETARIGFSHWTDADAPLARALFKDAPIVILGEPTAALDPCAERAACYLTSQPDWSTVPNFTRRPSTLLTQIQIAEADQNYPLIVK